ncbi:Transcriptional regulatory protein FixJ [Enhygromyxa salina]|uniref:Transcriptional regulatory protein FixJ n=1 Tax=Enhygromyxa salina TaxID=215803 RepID=A0A2S9XJ64_9BACT|nr:LuxR family transcriptional regulator [Enhygromyxa salina]PRP92877.1 Transcriptional regulatory protein FixJ [Enhygromyxa salina]
MGTSNKVRVRFAVDDDEHADKIIALLEALGYAPVREIDHDSTQTRLRWAVARLTTQARLTERERDILSRVLHGRQNAEIGDELGISKATVKWHMHNIFTKTGAGSREALLREALQLGGGARREKPRGDERELSSTTPVSDDGDKADAGDPGDDENA